MVILFFLVGLKSSISNRKAVFSKFCRKYYHAARDGMPEFMKVATTDDLETLGPIWMEPGFVLSSKFQSLFRLVLYLALSQGFQNILIHSLEKRTLFDGSTLELLIGLFWPHPIGRGFSIESRNFPKEKAKQRWAVLVKQRSVALVLPFCVSLFISPGIYPGAYYLVLAGFCGLFFLLFINNWRDIKYKRIRNICYFLLDVRLVGSWIIDLYGDYSIGIFRLWASLPLLFVAMVLARISKSAHTTYFIFFSLTALSFLWQYVFGPIRMVR